MRSLRPYSKAETYDEVIPELFETYDFSHNQRYDDLEYIGICQIYKETTWKFVIFETNDI